MNMPPLSPAITFFVAVFCLAVSTPDAFAKPNGKGKGKGKGKAPTESTKKPPAEAPAPASQIDLIVKTGSAMSSTVLAGLDEPAPDVRADIIEIQQQLLDEAAQRPVASQAAYQAASRLCSGWLKAFDERKKRNGSLGQTAPPTKDMAHARKTLLHWPDDVLTFARERAEARSKRRTDKQMQSFFDDAAKASWQQRAEVLQAELDKLYTTFREELRKPATTN